MTDTMPIRQLKDVSQRVTTIIGRYRPKRGWGVEKDGRLNVALAERQIREAMEHHAKKSSDSRLLSLTKHGFSRRVIKEAVIDMYSKRELKVHSESGRVYAVTGLFASKLVWMKRKVRLLRDIRRRKVRQ